MIENEFKKLTIIYEWSIIEAYLFWILTEMKKLTQFKALPYKEKFSLIKSIFAELAKHYDYFKDLHTYMLDHKEAIGEEFLDTSYSIALKLHKKLKK